MSNENIGSEEQRTDEWHAARAGKVTASRIGDVMTKGRGGGLSVTAERYRAKLITERLMGTVVENQIYTGAVKWGIEREDQARARYIMQTGAKVTECGFVDHGRIKMSGASPDGLVGDDGTLEIKCQETHTHIAFLLSGEIPKDHKYQVLWQIACTGREWGDYMSFDPRLPFNMQSKIVRVTRDDDLMDEIEEKVEAFLKNVDETLEALRNKYDTNA